MCRARINITRLEDSAPDESKYRSSHSTGRARQVIFLLETAGLKPPADIDFAYCRQPEKSKESSCRQENKTGSEPLTERCPADIFKTIWLLACLHNCVRIEYDNNYVKVG